MNDTLMTTSDPQPDPEACAVRDAITPPNDRVELEIIDAIDRWPEVRAAHEADLLPLCRKLDAFASNFVAWLATENA